MGSAWPFAFIIDVDVKFNGRKENLHSLWDTAVVELEHGTPAEIAARIKLW